MLRRRPTLAALAVATVATLGPLVGLASPAGADTPALTANPAALPGPNGTARTCADVVAAEAAHIPATPPEGGWAAWWPTSTLASARLLPVCAPLGRTPAPEPSWRAQVARRLTVASATATSATAPTATTDDPPTAGHGELAAWLDRTSVAPARVPNPIAALVDHAVAGARTAAPGCAATPGQVGVLVWLASPDLLAGEWALTDSGASPAGDPPGLAGLRAAVGVVEPPPGTPPPTIAATLDAVATWLCAQPVDLATPEGLQAALVGLLHDAGDATYTATLAARYGTAPLDPHLTIPRAKGRPKLTTVGSFRVATSLAPSLSALLADAAADGVVLTGGAYRSGSEQVARRRANCAGEDGVADDYDLYEKPSDQCSPRTARPGSSLHETGEAIDFEHCQTRATACYRWLARYAHRYGLVNLPEEPWHWSVTGQ